MSSQKSFLPLLKERILEHSGIYVADSQVPTLVMHIEKEALGRGVSEYDFVQKLVPHSPDFDEVINLVTVNETYFFREEKQFDFLKEEVFPKFMGKNLTIWTCCCSTGEEPISLLALALSMNINLTIYASDIDDNALKTLDKGRYSSYSLRSDGKKYHELLEPYSRQSEMEIVFNRDFINRIHTFKFNLIKDELSVLPFFENADIIFMRNVFIYFDKENRIAVTKKVSDRLKKDGLLFFSMNEIGSIDETVIPENLSKTNSGVVYYFVKDASSGNKSIAELGAQRILKQNLERHEEEKRAALAREVEKSKKQIENPVSRATNSEGCAACDDSVLKETYEKICKEINQGDFERARTFARAISGVDAKKYMFFMQGYIEYHADNRTVAETFFASAESLCPDFWPAFFYHGMVLRDMGRTEQAQICFTKCKALISEFGKQGASADGAGNGGTSRSVGGARRTENCASIPYDFALDSFSPAYIYSLCETFSVGGRQ